MQQPPLLPQQPSQPSYSQPAFAALQNQQQPQPLQQMYMQDAAYRRDDEAVMAAQKHAKWAISALNFEDVDTAVKELRIALQSLGAS